MAVGILAVQGAFAEHEVVCRSLGVETVQLRQDKDLEQSLDALILPGGESTVQGKLLRELGMFAPLKARIESGIPVLATCAGMILLANSLENDSRSYFQTMPVTVRRNAYGRQLGSFHTEAEFSGIGKIPMTFIRAPFITNVQPGVEVLSQVDGRIVAVRYGKQLALSFHPELDSDMRVHRMFLEMQEHR